jgi:signal transduction histidine kinase
MKISKKISFFVFLLLNANGFSQDNYKQDSIYVLRLNQEIINNKGNVEKLAHLYKNLGKGYERLYGFNKFSLDAYKNGLIYFEQMGDSTNYYDLKMEIGLMYYFDNYTKKYAIENYESALKYFKRNNKLEKRIHCELSIIDSKKNVKPYNHQLIEQLLEIEKECIKNKLSHQLAYTRNLLAYNYIIRRNFDFAKKYAELSQVYAFKSNIAWLISLNFFYEARVEELSGNKKNAIKLYLNAFEFSGKSKNVAYAKDICYSLSQCYTEEKNFKKANDFYKQTLAFSNQYYESEQTKTIRLEEINNRFENLKLRNRTTEQENRQTHLQNTLLIVLLIFLASAVLALFIGRKQQQIINKQNDFIHNQKIKNLELKSLESLIQGQENERGRIARDLHDGLGIQLSQIKFFVEANVRSLSPSDRKTLNQIIDDACQEIRIISHNIHPSSLSEFGLYTALEDMINKLPAVKKTKITLEKYGNIPHHLSKETIALLYRAIQELINNVLKHASAKRIRIELISNEENLLISVEDDGIGFDLNVKKEGSGITNVISRISYLNGHVLWQNHSKNGTGTSVLISIPFVKPLV